MTPFVKLSVSLNKAFPFLSFHLLKPFRILASGTNYIYQANYKQQFSETVFLTKGYGLLLLLLFIIIVVVVL